jgi:GT2 family glycosyltransferase
MSCDIVIISCNQLEYTRGCIASIEKNTAYPHRIIVVDNGSDAETKAYLSGMSAAQRIVLIENQENEGWVKGVNKGIAFSDADFVCVMNNDTVVYPGWLSEMVRAAESDSRVGLVNPEWQLPKRYFLGRTVYFNTVVRGNRGRVVEVDFVRGFCFLVARALIRRIGGLDLEFSPGYYDDTDYSIRAIKSGFICVRARGAFVWHYQNVTADVALGIAKMNDLLVRHRMLFHQLWGYPLRILFVGEQVWEKNEFSALIFGLLRDQHRVTVVTPYRLGISHVNFREIRAPRFLAAAAGKFALMDNARYNKRKRFDIIVCPRRVKELLTRTAIFRDGYRFFVPVAPQSSFDLLRLVAALKKENKERGS